MMSQLDDIDWSALSHAYGSADDIPAHLRALSSQCRPVGSSWWLYMLCGGGFTGQRLSSIRARAAWGVLKR